MTTAQTLPHRHVLTAPTVPASVRLARETAEMTYASWGIDATHPTMGPALLILSELVVNSVRHAAVTSASLTVTFAAGEYTLAFAVHDRIPTIPVPSLTRGRRAALPPSPRWRRSTAAPAYSDGTRTEVARVCGSPSPCESPVRAKASS